MIHEVYLTPYDTMRLVHQNRKTEKSKIQHRHSSNRKQVLRTKYFVGHKTTNPFCSARHRPCCRSQACRHTGAGGSGDKTEAAPRLVIYQKPLSVLLSVFLKKNIFTLTRRRHTSCHHRPPISRPSPLLLLAPAPAWTLFAHHHRL